jgi:6,7-dimethyl-8-ribityllumazine synthase
VIALACVIRGDTPHFEYVCNEAARGVADAGLKTGVPIAFGVLTVETHQQAVDRIGGSEGHKGREAAGAALGLLATLRAI